ncbi:TetR/AcrR family transcriptional regulator [Paenibacillus marinisediminis]
MARNKYPEQTLEQILNVSAQLFMEQGYDKTSIQQIIDALGMSKGAIYHHFKSKEEILAAVMKRRADYSMAMFDTLIQQTEGSNAREKLVHILEAAVADQNAHSLDRVLSSQFSNPQFVVTGLKDSVMLDAPRIVELIKQGIEDGSITTDFPTECAEIFMLLLNIWMNPVLFDRDLDATLNRMTFLQQMMKQLGVDIVSESLIRKVTELYEDMKGYQQGRV